MAHAAGRQAGKSVARGLLKFLVGVAGAMTVAAGGAKAADETRDYTVRIDGKPAGTYRMTLRRPDADTVIMTGRADVTARFFKVISYTYSYSGTEVWKHNRCVRLDSTANDNGKPLAVAAVAEGDHFRVQANGQVRIAGADLWPSSYWRLPDSQLRNGALTVLDADTGRCMSATLQYMDTAAMHVAGQVANCAHYRVTGPLLRVDLWYDGHERLVREEYVEEGHRTTLELAR
jgi:hypothetical protein